ncbi:MAG: hypothetical protein QOF35_579, partial [Actinomycetota bacterium]|nr:hypothetical protein [Actinomycetota bacterium]
DDTFRRQSGIEHRDEPDPRGGFRVDSQARQLHVAPTCTLALSDWCTLVLSDWRTLVLSDWCTVVLRDSCTLMLSDWCTVVLRDICERPDACGSSGDPGSSDQALAAQACAAADPQRCSVIGLDVGHDPVQPKLLEGEPDQQPHRPRPDSLTTVLGCRCPRQVGISIPP